MGEHLTVEDIRRARQLMEKQRIKFAKVIVPDRMFDELELEGNEDFVRKSDVPLFNPGAKAP